MMNLVNWLFEKTKEKEKIAISSIKEKITYKELYIKVKEISEFLSKNIGESKNVLLVSDNSVFFVIAYLAIISSGNVCVPLKYDKNMDIKKIKNQTESENIFIQKKYRGALNNLSFKNIITEEGISKQKIEEGSLKELLGYYSKDKIAVIIFTSGSTGEPKGVMLTHNNILKNTESIIEGLFLTEKDKIMVVLPFYYCFGASLLHTHLRVGGEIRINNNFFLPQKVIDEMLAENCTGIAGVPTTFQILLRQTKMKERKFPSIRCVQQAGGKLTEPYLRELVEVFGYDRVFVMYGQTEATARLSILDPKDLKMKFGSIGKGIKGVELRVLDANLIETKTKEPGEIYAKGENIMAGYFKDEKRTKEKIGGGLLRTGDIAIRDEDGFLYIIDREDDFIKSRGYRVSGKSIEKIIAEIPSVVEVAVVGIEDSLFGEKIVAYISKKGKIKKEEILDYCRKKLKSYELPAEIILLSGLPKNQSLKTDYARLKKDYKLFKTKREQND